MTRSAVVSDQRGCPTYVGHLAAATRELVDGGAPYGIWHLAAAGDCTWAELAEAIFAEAGLDCRVRRITADRVRRESAPPGVLGAAQRTRRAGAPALARGTSRVPRRTRRGWLAPAPAGNTHEMGRNVLVVSMVDHAEAVLRPRLEGDIDEIKVVVPVVQQGFFDWLANDEKAASQAEEEAGAARRRAPGGNASRRSERRT